MVTEKKSNTGKKPAPRKNKPSSAKNPATKKPAAEAAPVKKEDKKDMAKYECIACGYIYDPAKGDPANGVEPGTAFEDLPADWVCPDCGAGLDQFEKLS